jgi:hypothetical protein
MAARAMVRMIKNEEGDRSGFIAGVSDVSLSVTAFGHA